MRKAQRPVTIIVAMTVAYLVLDGGYFANWTTLTVASLRAESMQSSAVSSGLILAQSSPEKHQPGTDKSGSESENFFTGIMRGGLFSPIAILGYCLVAAAIIKAFFGSKVWHFHRRVR